MHLICQAWPGMFLDIPGLMQNTYFDLAIIGT